MIELGLGAADALSVPGTGRVIGTYRRAAYLDVPGGVKNLPEVWYKDHASGSNRVDKFERDIRLLTEALKEEPDNVRYWFYLAQSYRDAGQTKKAADAYAKRAEMGGWDEEAWTARLEEVAVLGGGRDGRDRDPSDCRLRAVPRGPPVGRS